MPATELKKRWANGEVTYGATIRMGNTFMAEAIALSGFDYIKIDMEHGFNWQNTLLPVVQAINGTDATPLVKVPTLDREFIGWVLDLGVEGITCPGISTVADAELAVAMTRHAPRGIRGSTSFYTKYLPGGRDRDLIVIATIESIEGVKNAKEIASVDGISGVTIGPADLAAELGLKAQAGHTARQEGPHLEAMKAIHKACKEAGVPYGQTVDHDDEGPQALIDMGCQLISFGSDITFFEQGMKKALKSRP